VRRKDVISTYPLRGMLEESFRVFWHEADAIYGWHTCTISLGLIPSTFHLLSARHKQKANGQLNTLYKMKSHKRIHMQAKLGHYD
jgi:hypothetical protein